MTIASATPDFQAVKQRQHATWAAGDYAVIGTTLQIVGERLCEATDLRAGERVLDVAAGNGNATLAAARRFAAVAVHLLEQPDDVGLQGRLPGRVGGRDSLVIPSEYLEVVVTTL